MQSPIKMLERYKNGDRLLGSRLPTAALALSLLDYSKPNNFVETGTTRNCSTNPRDVMGDGSMTRLFGEYVQNNGGHIWTCDIEPSHIENCKIATAEYKDSITYVVDDSLNFLKNFQEEIDFLYLDSLDGIHSEAHEHQLKEIQLVIERLSGNSIVLLDDLGHKTNLSIPFLKERGWMQLVLENLPSHYHRAQALMVHKDRLCGI